MIENVRWRLRMCVCEYACVRLRMSMFVYLLLCMLAFVCVRLCMIVYVCVYVFVCVCEWL